jgi:hypothetical protein
VWAAHAGGDGNACCSSLLQLCSQQHWQCGATAGASAYQQATRAIRSGHVECCYALLCCWLLLAVF